MLGDLSLTARPTYLIRIGVFITVTRHERVMSLSDYHSMDYIITLWSGTAVSRMSRWLTTDDNIALLGALLDGTAANGARSA